MKLRLERHPTGLTCTIGELFVNGVLQCHTLEDPIREREGVPVEQWKVYGDTAIPAGTYEVIITYSPKFKRDLPLLLGVRGFSDIRIHGGNTDDDTKGCPLVGQWRGGEFIHESQKTLDALMDAIDAGMQDGQKISIEIVNPQQEEP